MMAMAGLAAPTRDDLRQLETQLRQEQRAGEVSGRKAAELSGEVKNVQKQIVQLARTVQAREDDLTRLETRIQKLQSRQKELETRLALTNRQTVQLVSGLQTLALRPPELALINTRSPINALRSQMLMTGSLPVVQGTQAQVRSDLAELSRLKSDLQDQVVKIKLAQAQLSEQSSQMDRLLLSNNLKNGPKHWQLKPKT